MNKDKLRFLALGFFVAALILASFQFIQGSLFVTESDKVDYKQKYESLSTENEQLQQDVKTLESNSVQSTESTDSEDPSESTNGTSESIIFIIKEGEPSSVVLENLIQEGLITDYELAQTYLIENQKLTSIQYGSYTLSKDMGYQKVLDIITAH
ncbi:hypothetical protein LZ578_07680 [Jeotgalibaca sp. MA1X17-3]|uniref:hypothetical protein n=1 Tax=Jeotgalibaca sp. MA1X17-3 TaxID=2908211 RepID=UPI001F2BEF60|nr:hypothetical protein [Jeotgalibaca sp. MA1X17-3]UJF14892.1 hypothetical protein LZ578_07680 [Jeotgalibaca sp. MA1X17-3]